MAKTVGSYELATVGTRFIAIFIDGIILAIVGSLLVGIGREAGGGVSFIVGLAYYWFFLTHQNGQTPGKKIMNIRVIKTDGSDLSDGDAILRYIGYYINSFVLLLGWIWALFDANSQGWHDKIAQTYVVRA
ncbi:MAG: hypothetical protein CL610_22340 [Anaerolineaceae bacterium]|nr:hypothetical protein [Anaerolineaceae bacterium]